MIWTGPSCELRLSWKTVPARLTTRRSRLGVVPRPGFGAPIVEHQRVPERLGVGEHERSAVVDGVGMPRDLESDVPG
jgi:hypothetical protein